MDFYESQSKVFLNNFAKNFLSQKEVTISRIETRFTEICQVIYILLIFFQFFMVELLFLWLTYEKYLYDYSKYMSGFYFLICMMKNILKGGIFRQKLKMSIFL